MSKEIYTTRNSSGPVLCRLQSSASTFHLCMLHKLDDVGRTDQAILDL